MPKAEIDKDSRNFCNVLKCAFLETSFIGEKKKADVVWGFLIVYTCNPCSGEYTI